VSRLMKVMRGHRIRLRERVRNKGVVKWGLGWRKLILRKWMLKMLRRLKGNRILKERVKEGSRGGRNWKSCNLSAFF
jgi:hypothetical protein